MNIGCLVAYDLPAKQGLQLFFGSRIGIFHDIMSHTTFQQNKDCNSSILRPT